MSQAKYPLTSVPNFKDLGGIPAVDGWRIRHRVLYRSEAPSGLGASELGVLSSAGLRVVCDLRDPDERTRHASSWPHRSELEILVRGGRNDARETSLAQVIEEMDNGDDDDVRTHMLQQYRALPAELACVLRAFLARLVAGRVPALLHCAAGKDRTGFGCAVVLQALGVSTAVIEDEYLWSNQQIDSARIRAIVDANIGRSITSRTAEGLKCHREYLRAAVDIAARPYGSFDGYIEESLGLTPQQRQLLQRLLLEEAT